MDFKLERPVVFLDLETTGVDITTARICQVAIIKLFPDGTQEEKDYLINPTVPIPEEASEVHGITDDMVKDLPTFESYAKAFLLYLDGCDLGGYNSNSYDIPILQEEFNRCDLKLDLSDRNFVDVLKIERILNSNKLEEVYKRYTGQTLEGAHDALQDTRATVEILKHQIFKNDLSNSIQELDEFSQGETPRVDLAGKLSNIDGEICWTFGKNKDQCIKKDKGYLNWFFKQAVPVDTLDKINEYLNK